MTHEWKIGDRFTLEFEVVAVDQDDINRPLKATIFGQNSPCWWEQQVIKYAKLSQPAAPEPPKLDASKPMRLLGSDEASFTFLQRATNGMLIIKWDSGSLDILEESEVENIPEPKIMGRREAFLGPDGELYWVSSWPRNHPLDILGRVWVEITEGDGMEEKS